MNIDDFLKSFSKGIIGGLGFILILLLGGISYAAFIGFTTLEATPTETLTASKWNDMVDAVKDEYSTTETLTNKTWMGKPVYRTVINLGDKRTWVSTDNTWHTVNYNLSNNVESTVYTNVIFNGDDEHYTFFSSNTSQRRYDASATSFSAAVSTGWELGFANIVIITEYTKTTDTALVN